MALPGLFNRPATHCYGSVTRQAFPESRRLRWSKAQTAVEREPATPRIALNTLSRLRGVGAPVSRPGLLR